MSRRPSAPKAQTVESALAQAAAEAGLSTDDVAFEGLENEPPYNFIPAAAPAGAKIGALDIAEITLTLLLQVVQGSVQGKGVLRRLAMRPEFYETLSDEAQRFMVQQKAPSDGQGNS